MPASIKLRNRLKAVAELVPKVQTFADIGADHGLLSAYLLQEGRAERALCTDVNPLPLSRAEELLRGLGLSGRTEFFVGDGFAPIAGRDFGAAAVCGMGGELIAAIVKALPESCGATLVLQPMTRAEVLRRALADMGWGVDDWRLARDGGHIFEVIRCGRGLPLSNEPVGRRTPETDALYGEYIAVKLARLQKELAGERAAKLPNAEKVMELEREIIAIAAAAE